MYFQMSTETILTSLILVSHVWCRPSDGQCGGGPRGEGHKWFDGCQWCVCQHGRSVCTSSDCSLISSQLTACHGHGSSWLDGCYSCKCDLRTIECTPDKACLQLVHKHGLGTGAAENGACEQPADEQCIRGIDGVPSCTAETIDKNALPAAIVPLNPSSSSKQHDGKTEGRSTDTDKAFLKIASERKENAFSTRVFVDQTGGNSAETRSHTISEDQATWLLVVAADRCRLGERWYGGSLRCYCGKDHSITCGDPSFVVSRIDGFRLVPGDCVEGHAWEDKASCAVCKCQTNGLAFCNRLPSCHLPFSVTNPPLASLDTGAGLNFEIAKGDHNLDEENQLTWEADNNVIWDKHADTILGYSTAERELTLDQTNKATDDFNVLAIDGTLDQQHFKEKSAVYDDDDIDGSGYSNLRATDANVYDDDDDDISGDSNLQAAAATWAEVGDMETIDIQVSSATATTRAKDDDMETTSIQDSTTTATTRAKDDDMGTTDIQDSATSHLATTITSEGNTQTVTNPNSFLYEVLTASTRSATRKCVLRTIWVEDGCKTCWCNRLREKKCNDGRCRISTTAAAPSTTNAETTTNCIGNNPHCRPMIRPPLEYIWNRTHPVVPSNPDGLSDCGRFKLGERFWDACNLCLCTSSGPICTAKNCS